MQLPPLEFLLRMSPLAAIQCLIYAYITGEIRDLTNEYKSFGSGTLPYETLTPLVINSVLAFAQNVSSFQTNKIVGAVTITVCANLKQCVTILLGIAIFHVRIGFWNGIGMVVTLGSVYWYHWVETRDKSSKILIPK